VYPRHHRKPNDVKLQLPFQNCDGPKGGITDNSASWTNSDKSIDCACPGSNQCEYRSGLPSKIGIQSLVSEYIFFRTVLMAPAVEASSLSRVLSLADNPPLNPWNNAVLEIQQPLVLYIARVPGSKGE